MKSYLIFENLEQLLKFIFILFKRLKNRERERILQFLFHSLNAHSIWNWTRLKPGARVWVIIASHPKSTLLGSWIRSGFARTEIYSEMCIFLIKQSTVPNACSEKFCVKKVASFQSRLCSESWIEKYRKKCYLENHAEFMKLYCAHILS